MAFSRSKMNRQATYPGILTWLFNKHLVAARSLVLSTTAMDRHKCGKTTSAKYQTHSGKPGRATAAPVPVFFDSVHQDTAGWWKGLHAGE
jgi:hypothetical protein